jgi:hypothetical protein
MAVQSHDELRMTGSGSVRIAVAPEVAYAAVTDLTRMGEWSPVNRGGEWLDTAAGAVVGSMFRGRNRDGRDEWETIVTVFEAEPPRRFAFRVAPLGEVGTTWHYEFEPDGDGTVVTEHFDWYWTPKPDEGFRGRVGRMPLDAAVVVVAERERRLRAQVEATLAALKRALE